MSCLCKIFFIVATINLINSLPLTEDYESSSTTITYNVDVTSEYKVVNDSLENGSGESLIKDNGEESFYNLYCQAMSVVNQKLMNLEESDLNTFIKLIHLKTPFDCESTEKSYIDRIHEKLKEDIKSLGHDVSKIICIFKNVLSLDFDLMHYKHNTLVYLKRYRSDLTSEPVFKNNQFDLKAETQKKIEKSVELCSGEIPEISSQEQPTTENTPENTETIIEQNLLVTELIIEPTVPAVENTEPAIATTEKPVVKATTEMITKEKAALAKPEVYCQVKTVIDQKLIDFEGSGFVKKISWPRLEVDCTKQLEIFSEVFHQVLRFKFLLKGFDLATYECIYDNVVIRGYETLRYKTNAIKYFLHDMKNFVSDEDEKLLNRNLAEIESQKTKIIKTSHNLCTADDDEE